MIISSNRLGRLKGLLKCAPFLGCEDRQIQASEGDHRESRDTLQVSAVAVHMLSSSAEAAVAVLEVGVGDLLDLPAACLLLEPSRPDGSSRYERESSLSGRTCLKEDDVLPRPRHRLLY